MARICWIGGGAVKSRECLTARSLHGRLRRTFDGGGGKATIMADQRDLGFNAGLVGEAGSRARLQTPALLLDLDRLERNIAAMAAHMRAAGQALRPHAKTHKCVEIARRQLAAGAVGICCATLGEAEVMVEGGISGVLVTSPVVGPAKIDRLVRLNERAQGLMVVVDDPGNVRAIADAVRASDKDLRVLVDIDVGTRRTGVPSAQMAVALAREIAGSGSLEFGGIQGYAGFLQHIPDHAERARGAERVSAQMEQVRAALVEAGLPLPLVTGGGTGTHDIDHRLGVFGELQAGSYIVMDVDYDRIDLRGAGGPVFENALFVRATVVSANQEEFVVTDAGLKAFATDGPAPRLAAGAPEGASYGFAGDEHGRVFLPAGGPRLAVGDAVECVVPHCDPTVNLYDHYHVVRGDTLVDIWRVDARGRR